MIEAVFNSNRSFSIEQAATFQIERSFLYNGVVVAKADSGYRSNMTETAPKPLQKGEVTVEAKYSSLNYKDALAIIRRSPLLRNYSKMFSFY